LLKSPKPMSNLKLFATLSELFIDSSPKLKPRLTLVQFNVAITVGAYDTLLLLYGFSSSVYQLCAISMQETNPAPADLTVLTLDQ
ncbi:MAG: hypothetical protein QME49_06645, partial [bacterium]|nr:hypothetical protein [bacterium]